MFTNIDVRDMLAANGFACFYLGNSDSAKELATNFGEIINTTEVRIKPRGSTYLTNSGAIPPHTDHPDAKYIIWYCQEEDETDGENCLLDGKSIINELSADEKKIISSTYIECPELKTKVIDHSRPVWDVGNNTLFYAPWLRVSKELKVLKAAFDTTEQWRFKIKLKRGDVLIVDNHRMLHYREKISADSKRWLTRFWIADNPT